RAPAKINIRLKVTGRRHDGYHYLSMLNTPCSLCDELVVSLRDERGISVSVDLPSLATMPVADNLVAKVYTRFFEEFGCVGDGPGFAVSIVKRIPVGGGLGGGSSDAGAFLRFLVSLFGEAITQTAGVTEREFDARIMTVALACGADVPYAYRGGVAWVTGIGETVTSLPISRLWEGPVLVSVPPRPVPTAEFYRFFRDRHPSIEPRPDLIMEEYSRGSRELDLGSLMENDFEEVACQLVPEVGEGLALAREFFPMTAMTGSGSAIVSLVQSGSEARIDEYQRRAAPCGTVISQVSL
ncbi:MAG: 4-diphosphocytidyl-2-C-methyl-D-erythritol kinase, partial [Pseudomonadota bacterium]